MEQKENFKKAKTYNTLAMISAVLGFTLVPPFPLLAIIFGYLGKYQSHKNDDIKHIKLGKNAIIIGYIEIILMLIIAVFLFYVQNIMEQF